MTTNSAEGGRNRENYSRENVKREYRNTEDRNRGNGERRPYSNNGDKPRSFNRNNGEGRSNRSYHANYNGTGGEGRTDRPYHSTRPRNTNYIADKDKDEEQPKRRSEPRKSQDKDARFKEQQPDKFDIINRLEKEKKAMQKKEEEKRKNVKSARAVARPKRSNNIDWTREYENGSYDDDEMDMYLK